jgi:cobalt/nickel transport system permease protein
LSRTNNGFIERTVSGAVSLLRETVATEAVAARDGLLQNCDPRFKFASVALLLVCVLLTKSIAVLALLYLATVILAAVSSISPSFFFKRTFIFIPLFSLFIAIPALFNVVTPGTPIVSFKLLSLDFSITRQGVGSALIFCMRVLSSVSLTILAVLTTRHHILLKTLRIFRVPQIFVMTMGMSYRYIFLLLDVLHTTFIGIKSRVGYVASSKTGRKLVGASMGGMWLRSYQLHSRVYDAMLSRGYTGEPKVLEVFHVRGMDVALVSLSLLILTGTIWLNRFFL